MIIDDGQILMAKGALFFHDDMNEWELRKPREAHFVSTNGIVHSSNPCAGEYAKPLPWVVLDALWEYSRMMKKRGRNIGWCEKCCVAFVAKEMAA